MNLALYDVTLSGHHGAYITVVAKEAVKRGWRVSAIVPKPEGEHPALKVLQQVIGAENTILTDHWVAPMNYSSPLSRIGRHLSQYHAASRSLRDCKTPWDFVYASNLDYMSRAIQFLGAPSYPAPMGGMFMSATFHMARRGIQSAESRTRSSLERIVFQRLLRAKGITCITTADPSLHEYARTQKAPEFAKVKFVPEIGMDPPRIQKSEARARFGIADDDRVILVFGMVTKRKGIKDLLNALATHKRDTRLKVLVVGEADAEITSFLRSFDEKNSHNHPLLTTHLEFADAATEEAAFAASDAVWVAYRQHSVTSGVFYQAICCGIPVITADYGVLPWLTAKYGVGISVSLDDPRATGERIADLLADEAQYAAYCRQAQAIREPHLPGNFARAICDAIVESV